MTNNNEKVAPREVPYTMGRRTCAELFLAANHHHHHQDFLPVKVDTKAAAALRVTLHIPDIQAFGDSLAQDENFTGLPFGEATPDCQEAAFGLC